MIIRKNTALVLVVILFTYTAVEIIMSLAMDCKRIKLDQNKEAVPDNNLLKEDNAVKIETSEMKNLHIKARGPFYPCASNDIKKIEVKDEHVRWSVEWNDYKPINYTAEPVLKKPVWADPDIGDELFSTIKFNEMDGKVNRISHTGKYQLSETGLPLNVAGRTGMTGRGLLGKWGPNHAADPIVTRWKRDAENKKIEIDGKPVLEFVSILRGDTKEWAIPGGMVDGGEQVSLTLKREFSEEALNSMESSPKEGTLKAIEELFKHGDTIYKGYVDDPRNTDNAWMETVAVNFHDDDGTNVGTIPLTAGDDAKAVRWLAIDQKLNLYASHVDFIEATCLKRNAYFVK